MTEDQKILYSLAGTMEGTRAELDAMRMLFQAALAVMAARPENLAPMAAALNACIEADTAITLATPIRDEMLQMRADWLRRLMPRPLLPLVQLP
jgi:hypothetical protein